MRVKDKIRSPLWWFGGKGRLVKHLLTLVPRHDFYLEVFGGGANLLFGKERCKHEVYNDIDGDLVNFFRVIRDSSMFGQFLHRVTMTPYSRAEFNYARDHLRLETDPIMKAYYFFVRNRQSFSGRMDGWSYDVNNSQSSRVWESTIKLLPRIHERVRNVYVEQNDFRQILDVWKNERYFVYLDPPYVWSTRRHGRYKHEMSNEDHEDLVRIILDYPGMVMISGYDHEIYSPLVDAGWDKREFDVKCNAAGGKNFNKGEKADRIECVWRNGRCVEGCGNGMEELSLKFEEGSLKFEEGSLKGEIDDKVSV